MLNFKLALKEIFEAAMDSGKSLDGICDGIVGSSVAPLPDGFNNFITLGDYRISDVRVGELKKKFREVEIDILCGSVVRQGKKDAEDDAEDAAYLLSMKVRTLLKENKKLVSASYSSGLAITSEPMYEDLEYLIYDGSAVAVNSITYYMKVVEVD